VRLSERLLARRPDDAASRKAASEAAETLGRPADALRLLQPLVERPSPDESVVLRYLTLAVKAGRPEDGLRVHRRFAAAAGSAYGGKAAGARPDAGRYGDAIVEYEAALAGGLGEDDALRSRMALAQLYDWTGGAEPALRQWEAVMRARPRDTQVLREVGRR